MADPCKHVPFYLTTPNYKHPNKHFILKAIHVYTIILFLSPGEWGFKAVEAEVVRTVRFLPILL